MVSQEHSKGSRMRARPGKEEEDRKAGSYLVADLSLLGGEEDDGGPGGVGLGQVEVQPLEGVQEVAL